ncbi:hypothetical protein HMPREF2693_01005 [Staphylococcus sp. HMSC068D08]|uniref:Immunodominant staphylococcal antigen B n=1 Tax=Staphylococcus lugdunensis TaxID=28035 RepID=A0ABD4EG47_STALU|nr:MULTISPECIES: hypothetical protein [Staphylococcus]AMG64385.1 hypothetical protein AL501_09020 [Staphylococcus lugdunensis]EFU83194.1 putative immunodominant antigen B [Staphylococcus lugdunensis M23590]KXA38742.1 hypothetical protein HMPREF3225_01089 [Staphylococcus lugdunensis]MCC2082988.1 hypothetical protein [Staphylococcus lugdunensis]MCH8679682.1 hypothetical protein [Staphylococcus lugdunensis]
MKKVSKIILASSLVLGFSVTPELFNVTQAHAQESVKPYYNYSGYTAYQSRFILDKNFKKSLKFDTFKMNGYKITKNSSVKNHKNLYDQTYYWVSNHKANGVFFSLDGKSVSKKELIKHYGEPKYYSSSAWGKECTYKIGNKDVRFYVDKKGYVIKCQIISE